MKPVIFKIGDQHKVLGKQIAAFDFDWTIIKPKNGNEFPKDKNDWEFLRKSTKNIIKKYATTHDLIIFTSQTKEWKIDMIKDVLTDIGEDFTVCIGFGKDSIQKPNPELFNIVINDFDRVNSFYVGDAAGREIDWSDIDKKFAENIGIKFKTPEEIFPIEIKYNLKTEIEFPYENEMIIMVGYPSSMKSSFIETYLKHKYTIMEGDTLKTLPKIIKETEKELKKGKSVVIDRTNPKKEDRVQLINLAKKYNFNIRIFISKITIEQALELNAKRFEQTGKKISKIAFYRFRKYFVYPDSNEC
jgi:bifunctional polynucleotide phosphatase/kinase